jgi:hypothetical protein
VSKVSGPSEARNDFEATVDAVVGRAGLGDGRREAMREEMLAHLDDARAAARGAPDAAARALERFGDARRIRRSLHLHQLLRDVRAAARLPVALQLWIAADIVAIEMQLTTLFPAAFDPDVAGVRALIAYAARGIVVYWALAAIWRLGFTQLRRTIAADGSWAAGLAGGALTVASFGVWLYGGPSYLSYLLGAPGTTIRWWCTAWLVAGSAAMLGGTITALRRVRRSAPDGAR